MARKRKRGLSQEIDRLSFAPLDELEALEARAEGVFGIEGRTLGSPSAAPLSPTESFMVVPEAPSGVSSEARVGVDTGGGGGGFPRNVGAGNLPSSRTVNQASGAAQASSSPASSLPATQPQTPPVSVQPIVRRTVSR